MSRNHLLAETAVMCMKAGIEANPLYMPELMEETTKNLQHEEPCFYFAREIKRVYEDELNKIRYTRLAGVITFGNGVYVVYNLRDEMPKWIADGETKILWHMESMFHPLRRDDHPFQKAVLMFGADYNIALDLLQQIKETKKQDNGFFRTYNQILFVPMDEFGVRLLRLVTSVNWREELLSSLFEPEQYTASWGSLQFDVLVDGIDTYCFLNGDIRNLFNFRNTLLMRKEGLLRHGLVVGHKVICYPEQLAFVKEFFGDLAEYATVSMDDVERVLELDSPSLIE